MKPARRVMVLGGAQTVFLGRGHPAFIHRHHPEHGRRANPTLEMHLHGAICAALRACGIQGTEVQRGYVGNFVGELFAKQGHLGALAVAADPGLEGKGFARLEGACASGGLAMAAGVDAIAAGADVVLVAGVEVETTVRGAEAADFIARAAHYETQARVDPNVFAWLFARRAKAYKAAFGLDHGALAAVVEKAYQNATLNDYAQMRDVTVTRGEASSASDTNRAAVEDPWLREHLLVSDCTHFTDGAAAVVLVSQSWLNRHPGKVATELVGYGTSTRSLGAETDPVRLHAVRAAATEALSDAGVVTDDIDLAEVHDCFSITELQAIEALGLAGEGQASAGIESGRFSREGALPVNPGGGLLGIGHPVGATGVRQVLDVHLQLTQRAGRTQLARRPTLGITANLGGDDRTAVVTLQAVVAG